MNDNESESNKMAYTNLTMDCKSSRMVVGMVLHYKKIEKKSEEIFQLYIQFCMLHSVKTENLHLLTGLRPEPTVNAFWL